MVSISRQAHEAASVGSLFHYFDLPALSLVAHNDGSRLTTEAGWSALAPFALHHCSKSIRLSSHGIDLPSPAILQMRRYPRTNKANKGGTYDKCCASFSICRRIALSLVCRDRIGLFCRQVAIWLLREALNEPCRDRATRADNGRSSSRRDDAGSAVLDSGYIAALTDDKAAGYAEACHRARIRATGWLHLSYVLIARRANQRIAVQPHFQKYFSSRSTQIKSISLTVSSLTGAYRDRHGRGAGCGGRGSLRRAT
jgi:hypothetical protein